MLAAKASGRATRQRADIRGIDEKLATTWMVKRANQIKQSRFAAARGADECSKSALANLKTDAFQGQYVGITHAVVLANVGGLN